MKPTLLKAFGGGLETSQKLIHIGDKTILVGLILQTISYGFFCFLLVRSHLSIKSAGGFQTHKSAIILIYVLYFSSAMISVSMLMFWLSSLLLKPRVDSLYLSCCRICSGIWGLSPPSRRQVSRLEYSERSVSLQGIQSSSTPWMRCLYSRRSLSTSPSGQPNTLETRRREA